MPVSDKYVVYHGARGFYVGTLPPRMPIPPAFDDETFTLQGEAEAHATKLNAIDRNATGYELFPARKYVHVAAILSNGQRTARYSLNRETGLWYWQKGWKVVGHALPYSLAAYAECVYRTLLEA